MFSYKIIEDVVEAMLDKHFLNRVSFSEDEVADSAVKALKATGKEDEQRIRKVTEQVLSAHEDLFIVKGTVYSKQVFFKDAEFRVVPSALELEHGILIPGAAFVPFCLEATYPDEFDLRDEAGVRMNLVTVSASFNELAPSLLMLGNSGIIDYLSAESEENRLKLCGAPNLQSLTDLHIAVFDLSVFYRSFEFNAGDALIFRVKNWWNGKFTFRIQRASEAPGEEDKRAFVRDFEHAMLRVCEADQDYLTIPLQIAKAYLYAYIDGRDLRGRPVLSLDEYYHRMSEIGIKRDGSEWLLVPSDELDTPGQFEQSLFRAREQHEHDHDHCRCHDHEHEGEKDEHGIDPKSGLSLDADISPDKFSISSGTLDSIDAILEELNAPVNSIELCTLIYDAMSNGEENFDDFCSFIMDFTELQFVDDAQETAFVNFLEDNWELQQEYFSPAEDEFRAPLRTRLVDLMYERIDYSKTLLRRHRGKVPKDIAARISSIHSAVLDTMALLNGDTRLEEAQYEQLELRIDDIEDMWEDLTADEE